MRDDYLLKLAHDMGGALGAIMGYASILEASAEPPLSEAQRRYLAQIDAGSEELERLIAALRAYAVR